MQLVVNSPASRRVLPLPFRHRGLKCHHVMDADPRASRRA